MVYTSHNTVITACAPRLCDMIGGRGTWPCRPIVRDGLLSLTTCTIRFQNKQSRFSYTTVSTRVRLLTITRACSSAHPRPPKQPNNCYLLPAVFFFPFVQQPKTAIFCYYHARLGLIIKKINFRVKLARFFVSPFVHNRRHSVCVFSPARHVCAFSSIDFWYLAPIFLWSPIDDAIPKSLPMAQR